MSKIEPTYATFEQAKWLKEKGFLDKNIYGEIRLSQSNFYDPNGILHHIRDAFGEKSFDLKDCYNAPEQHQVVEWLRVNHGIWIELRMGKDSNSVWFDYDIFSTIKPRKDDELGEEGVEYEEDPNERFLNWDTTHDSLIDEKFEVFTKTSHDSPQEAYSAAFDYILKNLI